MKTLIIIPAFNEASNLPHVLPQVREAAPAADIVVVDDHSADATGRITRDFGAQSIRLPNNLGYGGAVQTGFRYGAQRGYDFGVMMDADGQHDPTCIPALLQPVCDGLCDVAVGSRFTGDMTYQASWVRRLGMRLFAGIASALTGQRVTDATSGFQAMNGEVMAFFAEENYPSDYPDADTLIMLHYAGFRVREVPVTMHERISGKSMHSSLKAIYYIVKMLLSIVIVFFRYRTSAGMRRFPAAEHSQISTEQAGRS
ncbi:MAG: glycosyltransferase family 2 protein [Caldilineales bacterium]|nr:glycosyltransferase family 2 protein [Caldilineales bacterium]